MNGASKILTVSYGTFSCTLEGFEDPFNTMKAIAEYFRDLAAGDRYFGAEPPQPDTAMLHRIAEREIQRRVEAKVQENGVILRAEENGALSAPLAADRAAPMATVAEADPQPTITMPARTETAPAKSAPMLTPADPDSQAEAGTESVAEKLSRLRKTAAAHQTPAMAASVVTASAAPVSPQDDGFTEDQHADAPQAAMVMAEEEDSVLSSGMADFDDHLPEDDDATAEEIVTGDLPPEVQAAGIPASDTDTPAVAINAGDIAGLMAPDAASPHELAPSAPGSAVQAFDDSADDDLMLEKLALVGGAADPKTAPLADGAGDADGIFEDARSEGEFSDDALLANLGALVDPEQHAAQQEQPGTDAAVADHRPDAPDVVVPDFADEDTPAEAAEATVDDALSGIGFGDAPAAEAEPTAEQAAGQDDAPVGAAPVPAAPVRPVRPVRTLRPTAVERPSVPAALVAELSSDAISEAESRTPITMEKLQRARARVIKIRRSGAPAPAASLSQEAEAALAAELAALEQDAPAAGAADPAPERRLDLPAEEVAVTRLMAEASTKMEVPDTKRRQSAIAHLKAAVAATIAERRATGGTLAGKASERIGAYRDDLAKVVRPSTGAAPASGDRPAPLVLVSEQRIDRPAPAVAPAATSMQPIRPRRPMTSAALAVGPDFDDAFDPEDESDNIFDTGSGFPEFAERLGATDLPDLLEAAAAYIACVEGRDSFTRPQLMRHIDAAAGGLSREDGLRSFGTLLRDGVIERSRRGQFAISATSPLLAVARKIAG